MTDGHDHAAPNPADSVRLRALYGDAVLIAYSVKERPGKSSIWTPIGAAYPHNTGAGLTITLDALPVGNKIVLLEPNDEH